MSALGDALLFVGTIATATSVAVALALWLVIQWLDRREKDR